MVTSRREFVSGAAVAAFTPTIARAYPGPAASVTVRTPAGEISGRRLDGVDLFTGIPFAASTAGDGRFRASKPAGDWAGVYDATRPAMISPQDPSDLLPDAMGMQSEDCLQLNVWAPTAPGPHPVFVWMHGGGNVQGSCANPAYDCASFARDGIVAINFNYRLGALGFLELGSILGPEYRGSGNNAMRDQLLVLRWVQRNVASFGGDPAQVTMGGESGGAFDLCALLAAPARTGLIKRAIVASGGESVQDFATADAFARIVVDELGGKAGLLSAPFKEIVAAQGRAAQRWPHDLPFRAVLDPAILPLRTIGAIAKGSAVDVDLMIGCCRDETRLLLPEAAAAKPGFVPPTNELDPAKYPGVELAYARAFPGLSQAKLAWKTTTAEAFGITSMRIADAQAEAGGRVHRYRLDYVVPEGPFGDMTPHGFDLPLVFGVMDSPLARNFGFSAADAPMARTMHGVWSSFIRTGEADAAFRIGRHMIDPPAPGP